MQFRGQTNQGQMQASLPLEVPVIETLQERERNKERKDEIEDGRRLMLKTVIERPISDQGVKQIVFDLPASVSDVPEQTCAELGLGQRCHPPPVVDFSLFDPLVFLTLPFGHRFLRAENPQGDLNPFGRGKTFRIPGSDLGGTVFPNLGLHHGKDALGILKEHPLFPFEDGNQVLVMFQT